MIRRSLKRLRWPAILLLAGLLHDGSNEVSAADNLIGLHSAQVMSQSMPWIAQEAGLFKKYDLDFRLVNIPSSPIVTAATPNRRYLIELEKSGAFGK